MQKNAKIWKQLQSLESLSALVKSWALEFGIQFKESEIPSTMPLPLAKNKEPSTLNPESMAWSPESKIVLHPLNTWAAVPRKTELTAPAGISSRRRNPEEAL